MTPALQQKDVSYDRVESSNIDIENQSDRGDNNIIEDVIGKFRSIVETFSFEDRQNPQQQHRGDGDIGAGHVGRYISLANPDRISQFMCHIPSILTFGTLGLTILLGFIWTPGAFLIITLLSINQFFWGLQLGVLTLIGRCRMRRAVKENWSKRWQEYLIRNPNADKGMLHIAILPNYKEDEEMLSQTVDNLGGTEMSSKYMVCVLAMEAREGPAGKEKADRIIARHRGRFKDIFATYHPANIPGEVAGKSSNSQWAFREVQRWYGSHVSKNHTEQHDISKVFLTVADADSLHHPDYFTSLSLQGLKMSEQERSWTVWQPPILLSRNFEKVPGPVRISSCATLLFELAGLVSAGIQDHCCFSAYSLTLALANHPIVDGWDADVIAEDHHMYMKCMMASYWEEIFSIKKIENISKLQLKPIWLPVTSYLAEDPSGEYIKSCYARFQQARRHSQGVAELSYILLQWITVWYETHGKMPLRSHIQIFCMAAKYCTVHIWNTVTALLYLFISLISSILVLHGILDGSLIQRAISVYNFDASEEDREMILYLILATPAQFFAGTFMILGCYLVFKDSLEGRYCPLHLQIVSDEKKQGKNMVILTTYESIKLFIQISFELITLAVPGLVFYGCIPLILAAISLSTNGHKFEYIVAGKPEGATGPSNFNYKPVKKDEEDQLELQHTSSKHTTISSNHNLDNHNLDINSNNIIIGNNSTSNEIDKINFTNSRGTTSTASGTTSGITSGLTSGDISEREDI